MARPLKPLVKSGGYYPSNRWTPLVYPGGYTTANGGGQPEPEAVLKTVTGSLIHITDALALPAKALSVAVEPIQDLHGQASPYPAGGGPNKLPPLTSETKNGVTITVADDGTVTINGEATTDTYFDCNFTTSWSSGDTYYFCAFNPVASTSNRLSLFVITDFGNPQVNLNTVNAVSAQVASSDATASRWRLRVPPGVTYSNFIVKPMFQVGGTAPTAYAPYSNICPISGRTSATIYRSGADTSDPTTYTIQLGDTVYGGTLDVTTGKLTVGMAMVDLGTLAWAKYTNATKTYFQTQQEIPEMKKSTGNFIIQPFSCSQYKTETWSNTLDSTGYNCCVCEGYKDRSYIAIYDESYVDSDDSVFQSAMSGVQLVYELATPIEITLTPTQIDMLLGENNLWADAGDSTLTYYAEGNASTSEALGILLGGTYNNPGGADDVSDDEALGILLGGS